MTPRAAHMEGAPKGDQAASLEATDRLSDGKGVPNEVHTRRGSVSLVASHHLSEFNFGRARGWERAVAKRHHRIISRDAALEALGVQVQRTHECGRGLIYFARAASGQVKIGFSSKPLDRLTALTAPQNAKALLLMTGIDSSSVRFIVCIDSSSHAVEEALHEHFANEVVTGEWFAGARVETAVSLLVGQSSAFCELYPDWPAEWSVPRSERVS